MEKEKFKNYNFKMNQKNYICFKQIHMEFLSKGLDITLQGILQGALDIIKEEKIQKEYWDVFEKRSKKNNQ